MIRVPVLDGEAQVLACCVVDVRRDRRLACIAHGDGEVHRVRGLAGELDGECRLAAGLPEVSADRAHEDARALVVKCGNRNVLRVQAPVANRVEGVVVRVEPHEERLGPVALVVVNRRHPHLVVRVPVLRGEAQVLACCVVDVRGDRRLACIAHGDGEVDRARGLAAELDGERRLAAGLPQVSADRAHEDARALVVKCCNRNVLRVKTPVANRVQRVVVRVEPHEERLRSVALVVVFRSQPHLVVRVPV